MSDQGTKSMPFGTKLEYAMKWGLPVSPLFLMILMMLAHAPYATPIIEPGLFYLACMVGAFVGFVACALVRTWNRRVSQFACWFSGALLEISWFMLLYGERSMSFAAVAFGSFLVGLSTGSLLVLCLCTGQTGDVVCEIAKLAVGFVVAYSLYSLFSIMPHGGIVSYLFPIVTCVPLSMWLHAKPLDSLTPPPRKARAPIDVARQASTSLLLATFGAGFAMLGFGGKFVEQGAGLAAALLVGCVLLRHKKDPLSLLRQSAMPLVIFSLCYDILFDTGNSFAFFLAGCGALVVWLYLTPRLSGSNLAPIAPHTLATLLAWIIAAAGVGMGTAYFALQIIDAQPYHFTVALVVLVVVADFLWRVIMVQPAPAAEPPTPARRIEPQDIALLEKRFGLSPRECQVAALLCENRSVAYICSTLDMATSTAKTHIRHVYEKAGVHSRSELQLVAEQIGDTAGSNANDRAMSAGAGAPDGGLGGNNGRGKQDKHEGKGPAIGMASVQAAVRRARRR